MSALLDRAPYAAVLLAALTVTLAWVVHSIGGERFRDALLDTACSILLLAAVAAGFTLGVLTLATCVHGLITGNPPW